MKKILVPSLIASAIAAQASDGWLGELTLDESSGASNSPWYLRSRTGRRASPAPSKCVFERVSIQRTSPSGRTIR